MKTMTLFVAVLALAGTVYAQGKDDKQPAAGAAAAPVKAPPQPMAVPKPGAELDALKPMVKNWTCKGNGTLPGPTPVNFSYTAKVTSKWDLNNFWADWKYDRAKTKEVPALVAEGEWGYDSAGKKYLMQGMDSWGGFVSLSGAAPSGDSMVFEGDAVLMGQKMPAKFTFTADPKAKKMHMTLEIAGAKALDDECK